MILLICEVRNKPSRKQNFL